MVKAILEGRKTQTRRIIQCEQLIDDPNHWRFGAFRTHPWLLGNFATFNNTAPSGSEIFVKNNYGVAGDRLWVRETWAPRLSEDGLDYKNPRYVKYRSTTNHPSSPHDPMDWHSWPSKWRPSIHMPRWASRITLEITKVRVERLQDISGEDVKAEGMALSPTELYSDVNTGDKLRQQYRRLWDSLHGKGAWDKNPFVWVIEFRLSPEESSTPVATLRKQ
jgi:hypothetical protein